MKLEETFDVDSLYARVEAHAICNNLKQTLEVLPYAEECHRGQYRKGEGKIPYIWHPLMMACHAISMGLGEDDFLSVVLLHDVCEDCGVPVEELPVNAETKIAVALLTKEATTGARTDEGKSKYYTAISNHQTATLVKLLDRCNNVSGMAAAFNRERLLEYMEETQKWFYPMIEKAKKEYPLYATQIFLMEYHMISVMEAIKQQL